MKAPHQERVAKVEKQVQSACAAHGVIAIWEAYLRFKSDEPDVSALPSVGIDNPYIADEAPLRALRALLPRDYLAKERIVFYLNDDALETRHAFVPLEQDAFGFHEGYTPEDRSRGWRAVSSGGAFYYSPAQIEEAHKEHVANAKRYWLDLLQNHAASRVVVDGIHYVAHPVETGHGFYGSRFLINWLDAGIAPTVCNLSEQGKVPAWLRQQLPDNATISSIEN